MKVKDIVCGMTIEDKEAVAATTYKGETLYFCSAECKDRFEREPEKYISAAHVRSGR